MNWFWPRQLADGKILRVRFARVLHWFFLGFALFGLVVTAISFPEQGVTEPLEYLGAISFFIALAMLGRGLRYIIAHE